MSMVYFVLACFGGASTVVAIVHARASPQLLSADLPAVLRAVVQQLRQTGLEAASVTESSFWWRKGSNARRCASHLPSLLPTAGDMLAVRGSPSKCCLVFSRFNSMGYGRCRT
jgi:hypothetical protein